MKTVAYLFALTFGFLILSAPSYSQSNYFIGVNAAVEKNPHYAPNYIVGINIEKQFCQKNSIALAVNYRHFTNNFSNEKTDFVFLKNFSVSESFLNMAIVSKYNFKHFSISFGPTADFLLDWKNKSEVPYPYLEYLDRTAYFGLSTKISKSIYIDKRISIEPDIHYNPIFSPFTLYSKYVQLSDRQYLGVGLGVKYKL
jgi:hypothetical protein